MQGQIQHLVCHYRIIAQPGRAASIRDRLDETLARSAGSVLARTLESAFGDDERVYVMRRFDTHVAVRTVETDGDAPAHRWGEATARALGRALRDQTGRGDNLICFRDQVDFVARFIGALLRERAWTQWYFWPFEEYRDRPLSQALSDLLHEYRRQFPALLARLHELGFLDEFLAHLEDPRHIWQTLQGVSRLGFTHPFTVTAMRLLDCLHLWPSPRFTAAELLNRMAEFELPTMDWYSPRALGEGLVSTLERLLVQGYRRRADGEALARLKAEQLGLTRDLAWLDAAPVWAYLEEESEKRIGAQSISVRDSSLTGLRTDRRDPADSAARNPVVPCPRNLLPGADVPERREPVRRLQPPAELKNDPPPTHRPTPNTVPAVERPPRRGRATPRQRRLLEHLARLLERETIDPAEGERAALRWFAALARHHPEWSEDAMAVELIDRLLAAARVATLPDSSRVLSPTKTFPAAPDGVALLPPSPEKTAAAIERLLGPLLEDARTILARLTGGNLPLPSPHHRAALDRRDPAKGRVPTAYGGFFLLLRGILDLRLASVCRDGPRGEAGVDFQHLVIALARCIMADRTEGNLDPALAALWRDETPTAPYLWDVTEKEDASWLGLQQGILRQLVALRTLQNECLFFHHIHLEDGEALICGNGKGFWPLGWRLPRSGAARSGAAHSRAAHSLAAAFLRKKMIRIWQAALGQAPTLIVTDQSAGEPAYAADRAALRAALEVLPPTGTGAYCGGLTTRLVAITLLRQWAQWLRRFENSGVPFLLREFIRRPGSFHLQDRQLTLNLPSRSLDVVLELAGYHLPLDLPWWGRRRVRFCFGGY